MWGGFGATFLKGGKEKNESVCAVGPGAQTYSNYYLRI